ncbi:SagB family peptide dehydrogenase [Alicyclobacillus curvatus]|nr:SagB family peptide dehydrogenase [Alicyclobacillus curvatus]
MQRAAEASQGEGANEAGGTSQSAGANEAGGTSQSAGAHEAGGTSQSAGANEAGGTSQSAGEGDSGSAECSSVDIETVSGLLWYTYGLTGVCQVALPPVEGERDVDVMQLLRRYVPSGGGLYPSELYAYLKIEQLGSGIYHYDVAHHRLVRLREGNFDGYLERVLGHRCDMSASVGAVFVSTMFLKNFYKYNNFAYRLQGLDAGAVLGQLLEVSTRYGFEATVYFQFLDVAVNHMLGLNAEKESAYAVVPLWRTPDACTVQKTGRCETGQTLSRAAADAVPASEPDNDEMGQRRATNTVVENSESLCWKLPRLQHRHYMKSKRLLEHPMISALNEASMLHSTGCFAATNDEIGRRTKLSAMGEQELDWIKSCASRIVALPEARRLNDNLSEACRLRYSPGLDFVPEGVGLTEVASLLRATTHLCAYMSTDTRGTSAESSLVECPPGWPSAPSSPSAASAASADSAPRSELAIACCVHGIDGLEDGAYLYDSGDHTLGLLREGDHRMKLQKGMSMPTVNLFQVPLCVHVVGLRDFHQSDFGYRGYRIQQMEVGMLLQCLLLTASAMGLGGHPLLGYDEAVCDDIYNFGATNRTCLIQVPVGHYRKTSRFETSFRA